MSFWEEFKNWIKVRKIDLSKSCRRDTKANRAEKGSLGKVLICGHYNAKTKCLEAGDGFKLVLVPTPTDWEIDSCLISQAVLKGKEMFEYVEGVAESDYPDFSAALPGPASFKSYQQVFAINAVQFAEVAKGLSENGVVTVFCHDASLALVLVGEHGIGLLAPYKMPDKGTRGQVRKVLALYEKGGE